MPYADREKQLHYMREYRRKQRALNQLAKLLATRERAEKIVKSGDMPYFGERWLQQLDNQIKSKYELIQKCDGLLKNVTQCHLLRGAGKP